MKDTKGHYWTKLIAEWEKKFLNDLPITKLMETPLYLFISAHMTWQP